MALSSSVKFHQYPNGAVNLTLDLIIYSLMSEVALPVSAVNGAITNVNRSVERKIVAVFLIVASSLLFYAERGKAI
jgi:hypothetical protein